MTERKWLSAVEINASSGQGKNQSIVVQFTKVGNVLNLLLKSYPTGDIQITIWRFFLHKLTKYWYFSFKEPDIFKSSTNLVLSSVVANKLGIYPLFKTLQTCSNILSFRIWVSENKNTVDFCYTPAFFIIFWTYYVQFLESTSEYSLWKAI